MKKLSVCVYCGSRPGAQSAYAEAARSIGTEIGRRGWQLVYGGGRAGLMGVVADAALAAGAPVVGVIPESLMGRELGHRGLTELHVVQTMHERKLMMAERSDAFVALPGGIGTFEELFEVWSWRQLGYHDKPLGLLNVIGYYDTLLTFLGESERQGLMTKEQLTLLQVGNEPVALLDELGRLAPLATAADDYRRI
ncbi:MAG TPA: TIGR00730 family Rossman fold protein [Burkholderiaceae bacterium]|nr:TIGR00730 family Rossman fold protein [Burkholderiaceae bacterium]